MAIKFSFSEVKAHHLVQYLLNSYPHTKNLVDLYSLVNYANIKHVNLHARPVIGGNISNLIEFLKSSPDFKISSSQILVKNINYSLDFLSKSDLDVLKITSRQQLPLLTRDLNYEELVIDPELLKFLQDYAESIVV